MQLVSKITSHEKVMASSPAINRPILFYSREPIFLCSMQNVKCVENFPVVSDDQKSIVSEEGTANINNQPR